VRRVWRIERIAYPFKATKEEKGLYGVLWNWEGKLYTSGQGFPYEHPFSQEATKGIGNKSRDLRTSVCYLLTTKRPS